MGRLRWYWLAIVVVVAGVVGAIVVSARDGGGGAGGEDAGVVLDDPAVRQQLDDLVAAGRATSYHATFAVTVLEGGDPSLQGGTVEHWSAPGRFREDIVVQGPNGTSTESSRGNGSTARSCQTVNGVETCTESHSPPPDLAGRFVDGIAANRLPVRLTVTDDQVLGEPVRCFVGLQLGRICLGTDGVPLRLELDGLRIEATAVDAVVPDAAFERG